MAILLNEGRCRSVASETPLTWRQVALLAFQASEECSLWEFAHWLQWGSPMDVGEYLWAYWVDNGGAGWSAAEPPRSDGSETSALSTERPGRRRCRANGPRPATAKPAGPSAPPES